MAIYMNSFQCLSLSPIELAHPGLAVATTRAGGVGVLDVEFCHNLGEDSVALKNLETLLKLVPQAAVGLRLPETQIAEKALLNALVLHSHWLIFCRWQPSTIESAIASLPTSTTRKILLEVTDINQIAQLPAVDGLIAKGHESGGWVGEDSAFVLTQKLITRQSLPVYVQGGIGIHTVAACRAAGAAGVVLDDQLWLMPESPLPQDWQRHLNNLNGQEATVIGERLLGSCRVLSRPGFTAVAKLQKLAKSLEIEDDPSRLLTENPAPNQKWVNLAQPLIGWGNIDSFALPMGQAVGLAVELRDRYSTTGRLIQALLKASSENLKIAQKSGILAAGSPLAQSHGTKYPIVQGPMTRVSDSAEFANAVASGGALPLLALALMRGQQVRELLEKTKNLVGSKSWGIGILGFVPQAVRDEQLKEVLQVKPPFALIAGGRPDQAAHLESQGIATYLHVPVPNLLKMFLEQGARRFVFEGRECGGHVGPLSSFLLWESMISTLLEVVPKGTAAEIHILFAGGIHDALSAAMVSAMSAPLVQLGIKVGVLMGSAYLFTEEAVSCGAIVKAYQEQAVACSRTINLETGTGHASRCAVTPFAQEFYATRRDLLLSGTPPDEIKQTLEDLTLGRLRIASKGLVRQGGAINAVGEGEQLRDGMYMIGQVATLRDNVGSVEALHEAVSGGSARLLNELLVEETQNIQTPSDIAIIGISTLVPKADYPETFWSNILNKVDAVTEIPASRWDWRLYYDADPKARDKIYSKWGGFLDDVAFDPLRFGIPPKSLKSIEPFQLLTLEAVRRALEDAGLQNGNFDREMTSVILGAGGGGELGQQYVTRSEIPRFVETPNDTTWQRLPEWTEESFPGLLLNVIAGRVANRFDLGGSNFTVDAACASSLAALDLAVRELESGRSNVAIAGGVDTVQTPFAYLCFSKTQALSPRGKCRTFDKSADGIAISEGIAIVVLKRLADAERDGDRIYGVIKSVASSSDGKALGMTAPLPAGQMRAVNRAYNKAGFSPSTLGLYEAHGTGTVAGDRAELETIISTLQTDHTQSKTCAIGSIKSMIGHTKSSAGIVGLIKATLALHHQTLPPHAGVETPQDAISDPQSPVYLLKEARAWLSHPDYPRRAGISAFGFGGTNFHAVLEEYQGNLRQTVPSCSNWSYELLVFNADSRENLVKQLQSLSAALQAGAEPNLQDLAYSYAKLSTEKAACVSLVVENLSQLKEALNLVFAYLNSPNPQPLPPYIQLNLANDLEVPKTAFLFPGQGAQYPEMAREVSLYFPEMRSALELADRHLGQRLSQFIYPPSAYSDVEQSRNQQQLTDTQIAQPAIGVEVGYLDLLHRLGITAEMVAGHSYGEYAALHAAGVLSKETFLKLSQTRGRVMSTACAAADGAMAAVTATREELMKRLNGVENVVIANHNAPKQSVISGSKQAVHNVVDSLNVAQIMARMLPVAGAFHSSLVASAQVSLANAIASVPMELQKIPVYANSTARPYEINIDAIRDQLSQHLLSSVEFVAQINAMYDDGARVFLEVGPKSILTKLVGQILSDKNHTVVSVDGHGGGLRGLLIALGTLAVKGVDINLTALFAGRDVQALDLSKLLELTHLPKLSATTWLINGGGVRQMGEAVAIPGKLPPLSLETATQAQQTPAAKEEKTALSRQEIKTAEVTEPCRSAEKTPNIPLAQESLPPQNFVHQTTTTLPMSTETGAFQPSYQSTPRQDAALIAYQEYQQTMRQFLSLQEQVMMQFLGNSQNVASSTHSAGSVSSPMQIAPTPPINHNGRLVAPHSIPQKATNGNGNGNGVAQKPVPTATPVVPATVPTQTVTPVVPTKVPTATPVTPVNQVQTPIAPLSNQANLNKMQLTEMLLQLVSDRTGYPIDMLGLDQDLEAELGIDSIKRVEIMGALQKTLPQALAANVQSKMETLTRVKSLNGIVEQLLAMPTIEVNSLGKSNHKGSLSGAM
jgi:acyl transferase domain-containing protein/NAD(P)H-dependent flavin oxidoreductase YrpB (nitropropane dioxygenase family)